MGWTDRSNSLPRKASKAPESTAISPWPPESTTPACFRTGSISGVWLSTYSEWLITVDRKRSMSVHPSSASSFAFTAPPFATVRMVPSLGFMTAL